MGEGERERGREGGREGGREEGREGGREIFFSLILYSSACVEELHLRAHTRAHRRVRARGRTIQSDGVRVLVCASLYISIWTYEREGGRDRY